MIAPFLPYFAGALLIAVLGPRFRVPVLLGAPVAGALSLAGLDPDSAWTLHVFGMELTPLRADGLSRLSISRPSSPRCSRCTCASGLSTWRRSATWAQRSGRSSRGTS